MKKPNREGNRVNMKIEGKTNKMEREAEETK